jgi:hypothetical protein
MLPSLAEQIYQELRGRIDDSWLLHKSFSRSNKAGDLQYPLDLVEASKRLLETSKAMKDTDACGVLGVLD